MLHSGWKSQKKVSFNIVSEASYVYIWTKMVHFGEFLKREACGQGVLPDRSVSIGQKLIENAKFQMWLLLDFQIIIGCTIWLHTYLYQGRFFEDTWKSKTQRFHNQDTSCREKTSSWLIQRIQRSQPGGKWKLHAAWRFLPFKAWLVLLCQESKLVRSTKVDHFKANEQCYGPVRARCLPIQSVPVIVEPWQMESTRYAASVKSNERRQSGIGQSMQIAHAKPSAPFFPLLFFYCSVAQCHLFKVNCY